MIGFRKNVKVEVKEQQKDANVFDINIELTKD